MFEAIAKQFLQSGAGAELLKQLQGQGLSADEASSAVHATAEGAAQQIPGMLTGGTPDLASLAGPVAQFVAQKTGISPAIAQTVVSAVLPKVLELVKGTAAGAATQGIPGAPAGIGGMLGGLLK